ncbi:MAG TPA: hypothetical protein VF746_23405 [Longimicrobium sp.]|jgi:hypothetical protein
MLGKRSVGAVLSLAVLCGCGDPAGGGLADDEGLVTFDYSGALSGHFEARGPLSATSPATLAYAGAVGNASLSGLRAGMPRGNGRRNAVLLVGGFRWTPGQLRMCTPDNRVAPCFDMSAFFNLDLSGQVDLDEWLFVNSGGTGVVTVTDASATRVRGTFSMTLVNHNGAGTLTVRNGRFDVPLGPLPPGV